MDVPKMIDALNKSLSLEYAAVIQYYQHGFLLHGPEREYMSDFFVTKAERLWRPTSNAWARRLSLWAA